VTTTSSPPPHPHSTAGGRPTPRPQTSSHVPAARAIVDCGVYVDGHRLPGTHSLVAARAKVRELGEGFVWVGLHEPDADQMREVAEVFGLHRLAAEDAVRAHQRPKVERYDDTVVLVLKTVKYIPHESISKARDIVEPARS
jgi:magnesium transporter